MKKLLALSLLLGSAVVFTPSETKAADINSSTTSLTLNESPQVRGYQQNRRWNNRRVRVVNRTRIVRRGFATYRETVQTRYQPNGRVTTRVISRVRIR